MDSDDRPLLLGSNIYLFEPRQASATGNKDSPNAANNEDSPTLIILCTWLGGATTSRITKYTSWYRSNYPTAHILLIRTVFLDITARSVTTLRTRLKPAVDVILGVLQPDNLDPGDSNPVTKEPSILLHIFSHGGCNTAIQLAHTLNSLPGPDILQTHLRQVIFDSCPGDNSFERAYNATLVSLPPKLSQSTLAAAAAYLPVAVVTGLQRAGLMRSVDDLRRELNDPGLFGRKARRLYLVSAADVMVGVEDVMSHAREGVESGFEVGVVRFKEAAHCALIMEDQDRYWSAVRDTWMGKELPRADLAVDGRERPKL
jgi:hypothetical protein